MVTASSRRAPADQQVVPLSETALARSFAAQLGELYEGILTSWHPEAPEAGFVEWAAAHSDTILKTELPGLDTADIPDRRWSEAPILASVGYRLSVRHTSADATWLEGMHRLMQRDAIPADRNSFFFRPVELLGLAVGSVKVADVDDAPRSWLRDLVAKHGALLQGSGVWSAVLEVMAARQLGAQRRITTRLEPRTAMDAAVLLWLHLADEEAATATTSATRDALSGYLIEQASMAQLEVTSGVGESGILVIALQRAVAAAVGDLKLGGVRPADFVVDVCRRFPLLVAELGHRHGGRPPHEISDEYDVQDLLRGILKLHFDDVRPEEWNPSYGGVQSRSDLLLKPERVIIETKMTRKSLGQKELVKQLIVDKSQYRVSDDCGTLVCFVYDPDLLLPNPSAVERDLSDQEGGLRTVVVVSPRGL
jgi:REase_DpnII-MboI